MRTAYLVGLLLLPIAAAAPIASSAPISRRLADAKEDWGDWGDWSKPTDLTDKPGETDKPGSGGDIDKPGTGGDIDKPGTGGDIDKPGSGGPGKEEYVTTEICIGAASDAGLSETGLDMMRDALAAGKPGDGDGECKGKDCKPDEGGGDDLPALPPPPPGTTGGPSYKILALHGGGGDGSTMRGETANFVRALPEFEFVFATAPDGGLWMRDPPGGKGQPTTDPAWDANSYNYLDRLVREQGPFDAIVGYSQGGAYIPAYLSHAPSATFRAAVMFCGYLPTTHAGIMERIDGRSPFSTPAFAFAGERDSIISNPMSREAASRFTTSTFRVSPEAGHHLPWPADPAFAEVVAFLRSSVGSPPSAAPPTASPPSASPPSSTPPTKPVDPPPPPSKYAVPAAGVSIIDGGENGAKELFCLTPAEASLTSLPTSIRFDGRRAFAPQCCGKGDGKCYRKVDGSCVAGSSQRERPHITAFTYSEAAEYCDRRGLELCNKSCQNKGCMYNSHPVYSSLPCQAE